MKNHKSIIRNVALCIAAVFYLLLLGRTAAFHTKRRTCDTLADVWVDVYHLMSQNSAGHRALGDNWNDVNDVKIYLSSHLYDGILHEWRTLAKKGLIPENCMVPTKCPPPILIKYPVCKQGEAFVFRISHLLFHSCGTDLPRPPPLSVVCVWVR